MKQKHSHYRDCSADRGLSTLLLHSQTSRKIRLRTNFFSSLLELIHGRLTNAVLITRCDQPTVLPDIVTSVTAIPTPPLQTYGPESSRRKFRC